MKRKLFLLPSLALMALIIFQTSCKKDDPEPDPVPDSGKIVIKFDHRINDQAVQFDTTMYTNTAGNQYQVNEIQYFISDVTLHGSNGSKFMIDDWIDIYYVDVDIPSTLTWNVFDKIPVGSYSAISFTFGITEAKNIPYMYVNPPESFMFWPSFLGGLNGGYHYLKLNGKWIDTTLQLAPFDFHLGVGQIYAGNVIVVDSIIDYVQNYFEVSLPSSSFSIAKDETKEIQLVMNIDNWFQNPNIFDHNVWGSYIMQTQNAMQAVKENGHDVFSIGYIQ
ncbi:MbnP family protein [Bacteroidota bacterium]